MAGADTHLVTQVRHPELVSGPIPRFARSKRRKSQRYRQVRPMRIAGVDEIDLPLPVPAFKLLFPQDGRLHVAKQLVMDQHLHSVLRSEPGHGVGTMLYEPDQQIGCDADVNRAVRLARKDVDARLALLPHEPECAGQWVLKQVQDDEEGLGFA